MSLRTRNYIESGTVGLSTVFSSIIVVIIMVLQNALALLFGFYPSTLFCSACGACLIQPHSLGAFWYTLIPLLSFRQMQFSETGLPASSLLRSLVASSFDSP